MGFSEAARGARRVRLEASRDVLAEMIEASEIPPYRVADALKTLNMFADELDGVIAEEDGDKIGEATQVPDEDWKNWATEN